MKYGFLGGTFDPPHNGHIQIAQKAIEALALDELIWIPANRNPLKRHKRTDPKRRLEMCKLAIEGQESMAVSDIEVTRGGDSFLVETLEEFKLVMPGEYWFILGMDALTGFKDWKEHERVLDLCRLAVFARPGTDLQTTFDRLGKDVRDRTTLIESPLKAVSSSNIRDMARRNEDFSHLVPPAVHEYIKRHGLYRD